MDRIHRLLLVHEPDEVCEDAHCFYHGVDEPGPGYQICAECGHCYKTAKDLRRAYRHVYWQTTGRWSGPWFKSDKVFGPLRLVGRLWAMATIRAKHIYWCQFCVHDF